MTTKVSRSLVKVLACSGFLATASMLAVAPSASAQQTLPEPYVSRALDAVLIPVNNSVASVFGLPQTGGLLVLATQPNGLADSVGLLPGDVIDAVDGRQFFDPIDLDKWVLFSLQSGISDFQFQGLSEGAAVAALITITLAAWEEIIDISSVASWSSYSSESFSYTEYYEEYSEELFVSYEESITIIEETVTSEEYSEEVESFESSETFEETEETLDESLEETTEEETFDEASEDEEVTSEDGFEEEAVEEDFCDVNPEDPSCSGDVEDVTEDEPVEEDFVEEEPVEDDFVDEGGDEGGGDEEILEE